MSIKKIASKYIKVGAKTLLSSDRLLCRIVREIVSRILFVIGGALRPINSHASTLFKIYAYIFFFNPDRLSEEINQDSKKLDNHWVIAARAIFEVAFARGELLRTGNFFKKLTTAFPHLFVPWKLLHYVYYFTKSWQLLSEVNDRYEVYRKGKLKSYGILEHDLIIGDQVTSSIGHSQIFFDFKILNSYYSSRIPKITICNSSRDIMSSFYKEMMPDLFLNSITVQVNAGERPDSINFIQDSFPLLFAKKYFGYSDERERTRYLASWAAAGSKPFMLGGAQVAILDKFLDGLGFAENDWYAVLHVREGSDGSIRNADISSYYDAIDAIVASGGWVFRIGDQSMTPLRRGMLRVVDLPFSTVSKPSYLDLYLLAGARFVICTCSGPSDFPFYFNTPRLVTNWPHMSALHGTSNDICVPVCYRNKLTNKIITLREQLIGVDYDNEPNIRSLKEVLAIKNTTRQIEHATNDMIGRTSKFITRDNFPNPAPDSLYCKYKDKIWFMGSIAQLYLNDYPDYLD